MLAGMMATRSTNPDGSRDHPPRRRASLSSFQPGAAITPEGLLGRRARVFVVDDHPLVRKGLQMLLDLQPDMQVCGEAVGVSTAKQGIPKAAPDLVVVDLGLEDGDGFELMAWLRERHPQIKMLVFSGHDDQVFVGRALQYGARGYVVKHDGMRELIRAIRLVMQDKLYLSSKAAQQGTPANQPAGKA